MVRTGTGAIVMMMMMMMMMEGWRAVAGGIRCFPTFEEEGVAGVCVVEGGIGAFVVGGEGEGPVDDDGTGSHEGHKASDGDEVRVQFRALGHFFTGGHGGLERGRFAPQDPLAERGRQLHR